MSYFCQSIDMPMPSPELLPEEVVKIQMQALWENDDADEGIQIAFNFSSPDNKAQTGPLNRFKELVKNPLYEPMLNFQFYYVADMAIDNDWAQQLVLIMDKMGNQVIFLFTLSRQIRTPYQGCWMTDSVMRLEPSQKISIL
jgi:hypothetical protein